MFKNSQKISISKHFLISLLFIVLIFTSVGVSMGDVCASDLNQSMDGIKSELNIEDKLGNSQENILNTNLEVDNSLSATQNDEILGKTISLSNGKFSDIRNAISNANDGDTIKLKGTFTAEKSDDYIRVDKKLKFTADSMVTLNGKGISRIFDVGDTAKGSTFNNIKFINAYNTGTSGAMYVKTQDVKVTNCIFQDCYARQGAGISTLYNNDSCVNLIVENCKFIHNHAQRTAGAIAAYGNNTRLINCLFDSNYVYNDVELMTLYGGAIQIGLDDAVSTGYVYNCKFINNYVDPVNERSHGGAGCVRDGITYENCIFVNNSAAQGGALTYHASGLIKNCTFINNSAVYYGGALSTGLVGMDMDLKVQNCSFEGNVAPIGGAVQLIGKNIDIIKCNFDDNNASQTGGAININAESVSVSDSSFNHNIANVDGGAVFIKGESTSIKGSSFISNHAIPDVNKLDDGLGGAIYVNSTLANIGNNEFYFNTARNGSAIYYDKYGINLNLTGNIFYENQAWVYSLPIYAKDIYYGETENIGSIIHGGNNIAKYNDVAVSNAVYNAANNRYIILDGESPVLGATTNGHLYQDDREYNMDILLTVTYEDGSVVYNKTLKSNCFGEVSDSLNNLKVGKYYVTAKHYEDTYYKAITNTTTFSVIPQIDNKVKKAVTPEVINYRDVVVWTLNVTNNGPNNATNVIIRDVLPEGLIYLDDDTNGAYNPVTGVLKISSLKVGEVLIVNIKTTVNKTGGITNKVNVTAKEYDYNLNNNHDQSNLNVNPATDLEVIKSANASSFNFGNLVKWTIDVFNHGPDIATGVVVRDVLPKSLIWVSDDASGKYNHETGVWNVGTLNVNGHAKLNMVCKVNATGKIKNEVSVSGQQYDYDETNNYDDAIITVKPATDLSIVKEVSSSVVNYLDVVRWTLTVSNNGPDAASGVKIYDMLPKGFVYLNSSKAYANGVINIGNLAVGDKVVVEIYSRANVTGNYVNVAKVNGSEYDHDLSNNQDDASVYVKPATDLLVMKDVDNASPNFGDNVTWILTAYNNGPDSATGVVVRDVLPKSLIWVGDDGSGKYDHNSGVWNIGNLNRNANARLTVTCKVNATGTIENRASISGKEFDWNLSNNNAEKQINVPKSTDLSVVKDVSVSVVNYLDVVKWTITVTNNGPDAASGVWINDILPNGFIYLNSTKSYVNGRINIGNLAVGAKSVVEIYSKANMTGNFVNVARVNGNEYDSNLLNNVDNDSVYVKPATDLLVMKDVDNASPNFGDNVTWILTAYNNGPDSATGVVVRDVLPKSLIWVGDDGSGKYDHNSGVWNIGNLNRNANARLTVTCKVNATGTIENRASISGKEFDWNLSNNNAEKQINVPKSTDLGVIKEVSHSSVNYLDVVKWTITVTNNGPDAATGVKIYDKLPEGFVYLNSSKAYANGVINIGNLAVGAKTVVEIYSKANMTGDFVNVARVNGNEYDSNLINNVDNASVNVKPATDLLVTKNVNNSAPNYHDVIKWTINVVNKGPDSATGVVVREVLPKSLIWVGDDGSGKYNHDSGIWNVGTLQKGQTKTLNIITKVNATGIIENNVSVSGKEFDYNKTNNNDTKVIDVANASDLAVIKLVNASEVNYLQLVKWTIIASNHGPDKATSVTVDEILPNGLKVINYTATKGFYDDGIWAVCCLENGESQTLELICEVLKTGDLTNIVKITGNEYDPDLSNNIANESVFVPKSADIAVVKTVDDSNPNYGDIIEWTITVTNNGPDDAEDILVVDLLNSGLKLISYAASSGYYVDDGWQIDYLANGASESLVIRCMVNTLDDVENIATVLPSQYDWNKSNNNDSEMITVNPIADLDIIKLVNVSEANYLDLVEWRLLVTNYGPNNATNVFVSDVIPEGLDIVDVFGDGMYSDSIWEIGDLANGESRQLSIICKVQATGRFTNSAYVWASETDPNLTNNEDENYLYVYPASDLSITKTVSKYRYSVGDLVKYSIKLTNNGPDRAENVKVNEIMDKSMTLKSFHASAGDFDDVNDVWSIDSLDAGESATLKINAVANEAGVAKNKVSASSDNFDPDLSNNNDTVSIDVAEKQKSHKIPKNNHKRVPDEQHTEFKDSVLLKNKSGNPIMVIVLLFVFTMGALYGNNILKKR